MNVTGQFILPVFILPRARINQRFTLKGPAEAIAIAQSSG
jgi:hypothetical protein